MPFGLEQWLRALALCTSLSLPNSQHGKSRSLRKPNNNCLFQSRGKNAGVWPPLQQHGIDFTEMSTPSWFDRDPAFGWSFWHFRFVGIRASFNFFSSSPLVHFTTLAIIIHKIVYDLPHYYNRYTAYNSALPHRGYHILRDICAEKPLGGFSFTSNIDGHWLRCGFPADRVIEVHGSVNHMQCHGNCTEDESTAIWPADPQVINALTIDTETNRVTSALPMCVNCGKELARPNVLMFDDYGWEDHRNRRQDEHYRRWKKALTNCPNAKLVIIEIGTYIVFIFPSTPQFQENTFHTHTHTHTHTHISLWRLECGMSYENDRSFHIPAG